LLTFRGIKTESDIIYIEIRLLYHNRHMHTCLLPLIQITSYFKRCVFHLIP